MKTTNSIDLTTITDKCFAAFDKEGCSCLTKPDENCGSYMCPYYKPKEMKDWVRVSDKDGVFILPPEEHKEL